MKRNLEKEWRAEKYLKTVGILFESEEAKNPGLRGISHLRHI